MASTMDAIELHQFIRIVLVAVGALVAAPIVLFLAESAEHPRKERGPRDQRSTSTQHPVMQY